MCHFLKAFNPPLNLLLTDTSRAWTQQRLSLVWMKQLVQQSFNHTNKPLHLHFLPVKPAFMWFPAAREVWVSPHHVTPFNGASGCFKMHTEMRKKGHSQEPHLAFALPARGRLPNAPLNSTGRQQAPTLPLAPAKPPQPVSRGRRWDLSVLPCQSLVSQQTGNMVLKCTF